MNDQARGHPLPQVLCRTPGLRHPEGHGVREPGHLTELTCIDMYRSITSSPEKSEVNPVFGPEIGL